MSKVITFSRFFPKHHVRVGEPTYFVEKIYNSIYANDGDWSNSYGTTTDYVVDLNSSIRGAKHHTIRAGNRWKVGDKFSPRVWSGIPRRSKQITFAPDVEIVKIWGFEIREDYYGRDIYIDGKYFAGNRFSDFEYFGEHTNLHLLAKNDGLSVADFTSWFGYSERETKVFHGQILCWNEGINY
ncbi:MAG TPA: hypothetical protein PKE69_27760 [Pyrinomonadaceae bacterium]|nr:hypothetical protein [Pyrinomonadaceae bacterium]